MSYSLDEISTGYAEMLRGDYADWTSRFQPYESYYQGFLTDPVQSAQLRSDALGYVDTAVNAAAGRQAANLNAQDRRYGIQLSADERAARTSSLDRQRALLEAKGRTDMFNYLDDRDLRLLSGGV